MGTTAADPCTQSNYKEARVLHSDYELQVDFERQVIEGYAALTVQAQVTGVKQLVLDTRDLKVHAAELLADGTPRSALPFHLGSAHKALGTPLVVELQDGIQEGDKVCVGVRYTTSPAASGLQFLQPAQTAGGQHPYLFSQCQAIHARSVVPCQDTPGVKSTYTAAVQVPQPLTALMSAVPLTAPNSSAEAAEQLPRLKLDPPPGAASVFRFQQRVAIPSYLLALAVGRLERRELGPVSAVWSEPEVVDAAAYEFSGTAEYLAAGEAIAGEYVWGRYDLLLLPPSFPYGGMENPCLTFVTPTLLAGDRSLTGVVAHEVAHSWSGNLVTNASWEHFWLNEGWTVFLERRIIGRLQGEAMSQFKASQGAKDLEAEVKRIGLNHNFTRLVPDLSGGQDPDDAFSRVPYEKGFFFLYFLQQLVGGPDAFDPFIKAYFKRFAHTTVTSEQFRDFFSEHFKDVPAAATVDWDAWLYTPGLPPVNNTYDTSLAHSAEALAIRWHTCDVMGVGANPPSGASPADVAGWGSDQVVAFLSKLAELRAATPMHPGLCRAMAALYGFDDTRNCEVRFAWYRLCIAAGDDAVLDGVRDLLQSQGRMKYLRPTYRALLRAPSAAARSLAAAAFSEAAPRYHPIARKMVETDLREAAGAQS